MTWIVFFYISKLYIDKQGFAHCFYYKLDFKRVFEFKDSMSSDPSQARYIRKKHANEGVDEQEQQEQRQFGQNLQKALDAYGQKNRKRNIEDQVQYFGHVIEPFNMREEEGMGDIDEDGFFVFKKKNQYKDAWLQSIQEDDDQMLADKVKKKVKTQGAWRGVYDEPKKQNQAQQQIDQGEQKDEQSQDNDDQPFGKDQQQQQEQPQEMNPFSPKQIKQLICQLLPMNKSANNYLKQLKKKIKDPQTKQLHDKILQLCNLYIEKTNEYDILTSKREQLQIQADEEQSDQKEVNWDQDEDEQKVQSRGRDNKVNSKNTQAKYNDQMCHDDAQIRMEQLPKDNNNSNKNGPNRVQSNKKQKNGQNQYSDDDIF